MLRARGPRMVLIAALLGVLGVTSAGTSSAGAAVSIAPATGGNGVPVAITTAFDLGTVGYQQSEFVLSGTANAYSPVGTMGNDGRWTVQPTSQAPFTTRVIVHRPADPKKFNGTVFVEWLNVSIGGDVGVDWGFGHNELIRRGYAWVGVSAQAVGVNSAKAGQAVRDQAATVLGGLKPKRLIASGESQSAGRMVTYINAIHPLAHVYQGFLVHSRGGVGSPLSQPPLAAVPTPNPAIIRTDNPSPTIVLQSETDVNE